MFMTVVNFIIAIPKIWSMFMELLAMVRTMKKDSQERQNKKIREDVENAKTTEEKQNALNNAGKRFGN